MKPTKKQLESRVVELSATLPTLRPSDAEWIDTNFRNVYKNKGLCYYVVLERKADWQVIRWYFKSRKRQFECMQIWMNETNEVVLAKKRFMTYDGWVTDAPMKPKRISKYAMYSYLGDVRYCPCSEFKVRSLLPILKRNGLRTSAHRCGTPYALVNALLHMPRIETLWKLKQYQLVNYFYWWNKMSEEEWQSIRIALKHGYRFTSYDHINKWLDTIRMIRQYGADARNPHYICPADLDAAHDYWVDMNETHEEKVQRIISQMNMKKSAEEYEPIFKITREQFFDMILTDGEICIKAIPTAQGIVEEGKAMHHCVGGYYNRPNSLILSATINGERIETIEVNLTSYEIVQVHGLQNKNTQYHERIIELVNRNMGIIKKLDCGHKKKELKMLKELKEAV